MGKLLQDNTPLPAPCIRLYSTEVKLVEIWENPNIRDRQTISPLPATPARIIPQQTHNPMFSDISRIQKEVLPLITCLHSQIHYHLHQPQAGCDHTSPLQVSSYQNIFQINQAHHTSPLQVLSYQNTLQTNQAHRTTSLQVPSYQNTLQTNQAHHTTPLQVPFYQNTLETNQAHHTSPLQVPSYQITFRPTRPITRSSPYRATWPRSRHSGCELF